MMIVRRRPTRIEKPAAVGFVAALVASVMVVFNGSFLNVWSLSTTKTSTSLHLSLSRSQQYVTIGSNCHYVHNKNFYPEPSQPQQQNSPKNKPYGNFNVRKDRQQRERKRRELKNKIHRARDSILYYGQTPSAKTPPSNELRSAILPTIVQSYSEATLQSSLPVWEMDESLVLNLFDPWVSRQLILHESRPVQERILSLLAVLMQVVVHIHEEYILYYYNNSSNDFSGAESEKSIPDLTRRAIDRLSFLHSQLWKTSREILRDMAAMQSDNNQAEVPKEPHLVSRIAVTSLVKALRESRPLSKASSGEIDRGSGVEEIQELIQFVDSARKEVRNRNQSNEPDLGVGLDSTLQSAWNSYLSSLCDRALSKKNPSDAGLETAAKLVMQKHKGGIVDSDIISYNTVMTVAAKVGNTTLVDTMWRDLIEKRGPSLQPNSRTYNTRLTATANDQQRLQILDKEIIPAAFQLQRKNANASASADSFAVIDAFTIDIMMMPLLQANRKKHLFQLIDHWMTLVNRQHNVHESGEDPKLEKTNKSRAQRAFQNAMSAFFVTLVQKNGDVRTARELWNRYMILNTDNQNESNNIPTDAFLRATNIVSPERRHYNIVLDGYARLVEQVRDRQSRQRDKVPNADSFSSNEKEKRTKKIWEAAAIREIDKQKKVRDATSTSEFFEEVQEKAIRDGQELFDLMTAERQQQNSKNKNGPDEYTKTTMIRLCRNGSEVLNLLQQGNDRKRDRIWLPRPVIRAAITTCGRLGDPSMACMIFERFVISSKDHFSNYRAFNVLLGALAVGAKLGNPTLDVVPEHSAENNPATPSFLLSELHGLTCTEAVVRTLNLMPKKNAQTYCVAASALQYTPISERILLSQTITNTTIVDQNNAAAASDNQEAAPLALQIFNNATRDGIHADGRLVNAIFRCYGDDIAGALAGWKSHIRKATYEFEQRTRVKGVSKNKNMLAAYNGLLYVCGRAERPDIAVRIVYAMKNKEGIDPNENPYNNYRSGKSVRKKLVTQEKPQSRWRGILPKIGMVEQYENILLVECKKFDTRDKRMEKDNRIRIIV